MFQEIFYTGGLLSLIIALIVLPIYFRSRKKMTLSTAGQTHPSAAPSAAIIPIDRTQAKGIIPTIQDSFAMAGSSARQDAFVIEFEDIPTDEELADWVPDAESVLMKEAEETVERIQNVLDHIASQPANPEEVTSKIRAELGQAKIFIDTEYYEAINHFIRVAVKRDTKIELSDEDIATLWKD